MTETKSLRRTIHTALLAGELPDCRPEWTWGGRGSGEQCRFCSEIIQREDMELELEFGRQATGHAGATYRVHVHCYSAWEEVRRSEATAAAARQTGAERAPGLLRNEDEGNLRRRECVPKSNGEPG